MRKTLKKLRKYTKKLILKILPLTAFIALNGIISPYFVLAQGLTMSSNEKLPLENGKLEVIQEYSLPQIEVVEEAQTIDIWITAYTSHPGQTDSTPCITASGLDVCERNTEDIIATNYKYLPFGTRVRFPELFGDRVFIVHDRMNRRYTQTADIWMKDYHEAVTFGRKLTKMEILPQVID